MGGSPKRVPKRKLKGQLAKNILEKIKKLKGAENAQGEDKSLFETEDEGGEEVAA